jgi:hypothetical protein
MLSRSGTRWPVYAKSVKHNGDVSLVTLTPVRPQDASLMHNEAGSSLLGSSWHGTEVDTTEGAGKRQNRVNASCPTSLFPDSIESANMVPL